MKIIMICKVYWNTLLQISHILNTTQHETCVLIGCIEYILFNLIIMVYSTLQTSAMLGVSFKKTICMECKLHKS